MNRYSHLLPSNSNAYPVFNLNDQELTCALPRGSIGEKRKVMEACAKDLETFRLQISCDHSGEALENLMVRAKTATRGGFEDIAIFGKFKVSGTHFVTSRVQYCSSNIENSGRGRIPIETIDQKKSIPSSPFFISLIHYHALFEGDTSFPVDSEKDMGLKRRKVEERIWEFKSCHEITDENEAIAKNNAVEIRAIDDFATAYFGLPCMDLGDLKPQVEEKEEADVHFDEVDRSMLEDDLESSAREKLFEKSAIANEKPKEYCHVFNHKERIGYFCPKIDGEILDRSIAIKCIHIFELNSYTASKSGEARK